MNKTIRVVIGAMAICGSVLMGGGFVSAAESGSSIEDLIPNTITLDVKESAFVETNEQYSYIGYKVADLVKNSVVSALTTEGIDLENYSVSVDPPFTADSGIGFFTVYVSGSGSYSSKTVEVKYSNTSEANSEAHMAVYDKFKNILDARGYIVNYHMYPTDMDGATIKLDTDKAEEESIAEAKKIVNDSSFSFYATEMGGIGSALGFPPLRKISVYIYKGDEFYTSVGFDQYYSYYDEKTVLMTDIDKADEVYTEMMSQMVAKGYKTILGAYELELLNSGKATFSLSFPVDAKYNGKTVVVLHKLADGTYEEFESKVEDGVVAIETSSLSPFMIALKETTASAENNVSSNTSNTNNGSTTTTEPVASKPGVATPDTGVVATSDKSSATSAMLGSVIFGMIGCLVAAFYTGKKIIARKKEQQA